MLQLSWLVQALSSSQLAPSSAGFCLQPPKKSHRPTVQALASSQSVSSGV
jgi:hypothetical protein